MRVMGERQGGQRTHCERPLLSRWTSRLRQSQRLRWNPTWTSPNPDPPAPTLLLPVLLSLLQMLQHICGCPHLSSLPPASKDRK